MTKAMQMKKEKLDIASKHLLDNADNNMVQLMNFLFDVSGKKQHEDKIIIDVGKADVASDGFLIWLSTGWRNDICVILGENHGELWLTVREYNAGRNLLSLNLNAVGNISFTKHKFSDDTATYVIRFTNTLDNVDYLISFVHKETNK